MNRLKMRLLAFASIIILFYSCTETGQKDNKNNYANLLSLPPYKGISDSINNAPDNVDLILRRALLLSRNNFHKAATPDYKKAWEMTHDENIALEYSSNLLLSSNVREAVNILQQGNKEFSENTEFARRLGEIYMQNGNNEKALEEYNNIIGRDSSNFEAWFDRGTLQAKMKDTAEAISSLERSFSLLPINYSGMALANLYVAKKNPRALEICDILLSRDTSGVKTEPVFMKGMYYSEVNDYANAVKQFDECIRRDWKLTDAYIEKGILHFERKEYEAALKIFQLAATVSNTDADAYYWMGRCFEATGKTEDAITNYERAIALDNNLIEAREGLKRLNS
jgi:tetratricopeptide (TPR) repeat protein